MALVASRIDRGRNLSRPASLLEIRRIKRFSFVVGFTERVNESVGVSKTVSESLRELNEEARERLMG